MEGLVWYAGVGYGIFRGVGLGRDLDTKGKLLLPVKRLLEG